MTTLDKLSPYWVKTATVTSPTIPYRLLIFNDVGNVNAEAPTGVGPYYTAAGNATGDLNQIVEYYNGGPEEGGVYGPAWGISFTAGWYKCVSTACSVAPPVHP